MIIQYTLYALAFLIGCALARVRWADLYDRLTDRTNIYHVTCLLIKQDGTISIYSDPVRCRRFTGYELHNIHARCMSMDKVVSAQVIGVVKLDWSNFWEN